MSTYEFPFPEPPAPGEMIDIVPGIKWLRLPLPYRLDHVNIYLIEDGDGWCVLDAGLHDDRTMELWEAVLTGPLAGSRLTRLIVTHHHPDHIGTAGWLCRRAGIPLLTSQTAYLACANLALDPGSPQDRQFHDFYINHGTSREVADLMGSQGLEYLRKVAPLPNTFLRLLSGDTLVIGSRRFRIFTGDGHAPEQVMLYCEEDGLFFSADQVIAKISPNVSVWPSEPDGDPLGHFLRTARRIRDNLPDDVLVLPGHQLPFRGLHARCNELVAHHDRRCDLIGEAAADRPMTVNELVPVVFPRELDIHQFGFAFSETLAHVNRMMRRSELAKSTGDDGVVRYVSTVPAS
ncbi:MBL fold metallo-hydrolase [Oricola sp.]|uniref:MBL fold metallo-hydrolase n=1 Tax=Oricola sp. TaxID=1979950 RepID=UPI0025CD15D2|nr:MBL fold metallo-hydrolase [Oricola sp.]MCI5074540.1 MBL fold metallo-hydrolase [Oricola sp.]